MLPVIMWIVIAITVVLIDAATGSFLFCWFAVGALGAMVAALFGATLGVQIILFFVLSIVTVLLGYPWAKKKFKDTIQHTPLMEEKYIGMVIVADEDIQGKARIKLDGCYWTVDSGFEKILKGERFKIKEIVGNKLMIMREE